MSKVHWKKLTNPNYLGAYSFESDELERKVKIEKVIREMVTGHGGRKTECTVAYLKDSKPMILNKTNCKLIQDIYSTPYIEDWIGKEIILYVKNISFKGDYTDALRVKPEMPKKPQNQILTPEHKKWNDCKKALVGGYTIEQITNKYVISPENLKLLTDG